MVDEFTRKVDALDLASSIAKNHKQKFIVVDGKITPNEK